MKTDLDVSVAMDDLGTGEPVLLCIPGWCGDRAVFDPLLARLSRSRRVIAVDLPGHGASGMPDWDFDSTDVVAAAIDVVETTGLERVVPVALSHAGWFGIELRRQLGPTRVPGLVLLDWMVLGPPPGFVDALAGLQNPNTWQDVRTALFSRWRDGIDAPALHKFVDSMGEYGAEMWSRAGREIAISFAAEDSPLPALECLDEPCSTLHLYAQPADDAVLHAQQVYAEEHSWFSVQRLSARSHFPMFEVPDDMVAVIESFARSVA